MKRTSKLSKVAVAFVVAVVGAVSAGESKAGSIPDPFKRIATANPTTAAAVAMARTTDGSLHLVYQTFSGTSPSGLASLTIGIAGLPDVEVQALSGWQAGQPGLVALPNGTLEALFSGTSPSPGLVPSVWGITSSDGGATWSAPTNVRGGGPNEALAYGSNVTAGLAGSTPVLTLPQAGNIVVQTGLGAGSPSFVLTNSLDGATTDADFGVDATTREVVASWPSVAHEPALWLQGVAPTLGSAQQVPGQSRTALVLAGRDTGPGVFGAYTPDGTHVRLLRYGGGSVAVGSRAGTTAKVLGVATGLDGRIWVMWGDDGGGGIAFTRSNKAVTRFEPIQDADPRAGSIYRVQGDGRLGPLDLLVDAIPSGKGPVQPTGLYYARVWPELSATASVTAVKNKGLVVAHKLSVVVTDAGDPVAGATVSAKGQQKKTNAQGVAVLTLAGAAGGPATVTVTAPKYRVLTETVQL
jgi:hypothetical protein